MRHPERLPKVPRRIKQVAHKFTHNKRLGRRERRRLINWLQARRRDIGAEPMRARSDGRYWLFDLW
jgi:hypothetical protein